MEKVILNSDSPQPDIAASFSASVLNFDLPDLIRNMKHSHAWIKGDLNAMILLKNPEKQVVLAALHEGTEIVSFQSNDSITFHIIEGSLKFNTRKDSAIIDTGQMLTLSEKVKYRLKTREETVLLLSIEKDTLKRA
jgi:quercetin dioxygenase-like cupin family protein